MPIYEFYCNHCETIFEYLQLGFNNNSTPICSKCKSTNNKRILSHHINYYIPNDYELGKRPYWEGVDPQTNAPLEIHSKRAEDLKRHKGTIP